MFLRILITNWAIVLAGTIALFAFPKHTVWLRHPGYLRAYFITLALVSIGYAVARIYREGIKLSKPNKPLDR